MQAFNNLFSLVVSLFEGYSEDTTIAVDKNGDPIKSKTFFSWVRFTMNLIVFSLPKEKPSGNNVAIVMENSVQWLVAFFATILTGNIPVLITSMQPSAWLRYSILVSGRCTLLISTESIIEKARLNDLKDHVSVITIDKMENGDFEIEPDWISTNYTGYPLNPNSVCMITFTSLGMPVAHTNKTVLYALAANRNALICLGSTNYVPLLLFSTLPVLTVLVPLSLHMPFVLTDKCRINWNEWKRYYPKMLVLSNQYFSAIFQQLLKPTVSNFFKRFLFNFPFIGKYVQRQLRKDLLEFFGGNVKSFIVLGTLHSSVKPWLDKIKFPYVESFSSDLTGGLISTKHILTEYVGKVTQSINTIEPGISHLLINPEVAAMYYDKFCTMLSEQGWYRLPDIGEITDAGTTLKLKGTTDTVVESTFGLPVYLEELEDMVTQMPYVKDAMVISIDKGPTKHFVALVVLDEDLANTHLQSLEQVKEVLNFNLKVVNSYLASYSRINNLVVSTLPLDKTKRHLYSSQNADISS